MRHRATTTFAAIAVLCIAVGLPSAALGQSSTDIVGAWTLVSSESVRPDGTKASTFGTNPRGMIVFTADGRFIYLFSRNDLPKIATNIRTTATPDESKAVVHGSIATFGTYALAGKELSLKVSNSTFANWVDTDQKRTVMLAGDDLKWTNPAGSGGGVVELAFKRAK